MSLNNLSGRKYLLEKYLKYAVAAFSVWAGSVPSGPSSNCQAPLLKDSIWKKARIENPFESGGLKFRLHQVHPLRVVKTLANACYTPVMIDLNEYRRKKEQQREDALRPLLDALGVQSVAECKQRYSASTNDRAERLAKMDESLERICAMPPSPGRDWLLALANGTQDEFEQATKRFTHQLVSKNKTPKPMAMGFWGVGTLLSNNRMRLFPSFGHGRNSVDQNFSHCQSHQDQHDDYDRSHSLPPKTEKVGMTFFLVAFGHPLRCLKSDHLH